MNKYLVFIGMVSELVGMIIASAFIGKQIDDYYKLPGVFIGLLCFISLVAWSFQINYLLKKVGDK